MTHPSLYYRALQCLDGTWVVAYTCLSQTWPTIVNPGHSERSAKAAARRMNADAEEEARRLDLVALEPVDRPIVAEFYLEP